MDDMEDHLRILPATSRIYHTSCCRGSIDMEDHL
jgi:hypothetical protein